MNRRILWVAFLAYVLSPIGALRAHEQHHTHPALAAASLELLDSDFYDADAQAAILTGTIIEDDGSRDGFPTFCWHFYNPLIGTSVIGACDALDFLDLEWTERNAGAAAEMIWPIRETTDDPFEQIGRVLHLLQDMTSPAHVHDDPHGGTRDCPDGTSIDLTSVDDFEIWGWDVCTGTGAIDTYVQTEVEGDQVVSGQMRPLLEKFLDEGPGYRPRLPVDLSPLGFIDAVANETFEHTTFDGVLTVGDPQPDSELSRMFPERLGRPTSLWIIDDVGAYDAADLACITGGEWWPMANECKVEGDVLSGRFYIENVRGNDENYYLVPAVWERPGRFQSTPNERSLLQIYGHTLYPLAVAYGAGLLQVFEEVHDRPVHFDDVSPEDHWAESYIRYLRLHDVVAGFPDGTFLPDQPVTRAEVLKIAYLAAAEPFDFDPDCDTPSGFDDVHSEDWFCPYVADALAKEFIEGVPCGGGTCFEPNRNVNRAEALKLIAELFGLDLEPLDCGSDESKSGFPDVPCEEDGEEVWFHKYVYWATRAEVDNGFAELGIFDDEKIVEGYSDGWFRPSDDVTRAELSKMATGAMLYCRATTSTASCQGDPSSAGAEASRLGRRQAVSASHSLGNMYEHRTASATPNLHAPPPFLLPGGNQQTVAGPIALDDHITEDDDGDRLHVVWTATGGTLSSNDEVHHSTATWTPPEVEVPSLFRVWVQRSDDRGKVTQDVMEFTVLPADGAGAASGTVTAPNGSQVGTVTVSASVADSDGLERVSVAFAAGEPELVLCGADGPAPCAGTSATLSRPGVDPAAFGASEGTVTLTLFVEDTVGNREAVGTHSFTWGPPATGSGLTLTVIKEGTGDGTVSGSGIDCPPGCREAVVVLTEGTQIDLVGSGEQFIGFSGEICYGADPCGFGLYRDTTVHAGFALPEAFQVLFSTPASGDSGVPTNTPPTLFFNRDAFPGPGLGAISFTDDTSAPVLFQAVVRSSDRRLVLVPEAPLRRGRTYEIVVPSDAVQDAAGTALASPWGFTFTVEEEGEPQMYLSAYPRRVMEGEQTRVSLWFAVPAATARDIDLASDGDHLEIPSFVTLEAGATLVEVDVGTRHLPASLDDVVETLQATDPATGQTRSVQLHVLNSTPQFSSHLAWLASSTFEDEDGDGVFEAGETAEILFEAGNIGSQGVSGVYLELAVLDTTNLRILGGSSRCDLGFLSPGEGDSCSRTVLADDELPSGSYAIRVSGFSNLGGFIDTARVDVVNNDLPDFQVTTGAITSNALEPGRVIQLNVSARNGGDGFSLALPLVEVVMEIDGSEQTLYQVHADARGDILGSQDFTLPITAPSTPGSYPIRARINPPGSEWLPESDTTNNLAAERILHVAFPNRAPVLAPLGGPFRVAAGEVLELEAQATDEDGDSLQYRLAPGAPAGMTVDGATGTVTWSVLCDMLPGTHGAELVVEDPEGGADSRSFVVEVRHQADRGVSLSADAALVTPGQEVELTLEVTNHGPTCVTDMTAEIEPHVSAAVTDWTCTATDESYCSPGQTGPLHDDALNLTSGGVATYRARLRVMDTANGVLDLRAPVGLPAGVEDPYGANDVGSESLSLRSLDFGDAPDATEAPGFSFPTTLAAGGARHGVDPAMRLGALVDGEAEGRPSYAATGDDASGSDDEDGVIFSTELVPCDTATVEVHASAPGFLSAWIDFGRDGSWSEAGDRIATDQSLSAGVNAVDYAVPCSAGAGSTYSRFRISSAGGLAFGGVAADGEVEDHTVSISSLLRTLEVDVLGTGTGEIVLLPGGVPCGGGCSADFQDGTEVELIASASPGSAFLGWDDAGCPGTGTCRLVMDRNRSVGATFALAEPCYSLALRREGSGQVPTASPTGTDGCEPQHYRTGESIVLTAGPSPGWAVAGWQGTENDTSTATSNQLLMPSQDLEVAVIYLPTGPPTVLLVDDDDDDPDVREAYTEALEALGVLYDVWDTQGSDDEPPATTLASYPAIVWFTGGAFRGSAGPGGAAEADLGAYLESGGCLVLSSQDYLTDRGQTSFMSQYLGLASGIDDRKHDFVTGQGSLFGGMGPFALSFPVAESLENFSDLLLPGSSSELAFQGDAGEAGIATAASGYRTIYLGFPVEALESKAAIRQILSTSLNFCDRQCASPFHVDLSGESLDTTREVFACDRITAGNGYQVLDGGVLTLRAPGRVILRDGFSVAPGGTLRVVIEP